MDNQLPAVEALTQYFETHLPEYLAILQRMVAINSFTANPRGVNELGVVSAETFAALGFHAEFVQSDNPMYGKHLVLTRRGKRPAGQPVPTLGLVSHLDTVFPPDEEARNDFQWREAGDRIYGPGTIDIKGGTVMIYMMLVALRDLAPAVFASTSWIVLLDANEETGGMDFGRLCLKHLRKNVRGCLIFEPGQWRAETNTFPLVASRKGMAVFRIEVEGRGAHAGSSHAQGANAIVQMAEVIQRVQALTDYDRHLTFNVGTVAGGSVINRVPHFVSASVEMRTFEPDVFEDGVAAMLALNGLSTVASAEGNFGCRVRVDLLNRIAPWPRNAGTAGLIAHWQATAEALNMRVEPEDRGGLSDGNFFWQGVASVDGLGPAGANAHCSESSDDGSKEQEYVRVASFVPKAVLNTLAVAKLVIEP